MDISFIKSKLLSLSIQTEQDGLEDNFKLKHSSGFSEKNTKQFVVKFDVNITSELGISISLEYAGIFETSSEITEEFRNCQFITVNAPAITYPYLRSYITTITVNAGLSPMILPTINFQALADEKNKDA